MLTPEQKNQKILRIGLNISLQRKLKKITQAQLADALNISRTTMSFIEAPNIPYKISLDLLLDIADYLEIPPSSIFDGV